MKWLTERFAKETRATGFEHHRPRHGRDVSRCLIGWFTTVVLSITASLLPYPAIADEDYYSLTVGAEYITGDFGGSETIDQWYVPVTAKYYTGHYVYRLTVPYVRVTAPAGTIIVGPGGELIATGMGTRMTEDGVGDVIAGITYRDVFHAKASDWLVDLTGKIKFGTANENDGLGTGENDFYVQADVLKRYGKLVPYATIGYKFRGDPPDVDLRNAWFGLVGGKYLFSKRISGGLNFYYAETSYPDSEDKREWTVQLGYKLNKDQHLHGYLIGGLSDGSPDWGIGVMITTRLGR